LTSTHPSRAYLSRAYLSLGSNKGNGPQHIASAIEALADSPAISIKAQSPLYRTKPVGPIEQDDFTNAALVIETTLSPEDLMALCHSIERQMGRDRAQEQRWGPRLIDIDLIAYGTQTRNGPDLILPHPRFAERAFVLVPLNAIAPDDTIGGHKIKDYLARLDQKGVDRIRD
jgi:2-amino-4-hydroxy-6-hydroxymethyldihydropteridine diphosphokinase